MRKRIAITGGIACGKSLFSLYLEQLGVAILDADTVVHSLEAPGGEAVPALRAVFGERIIRPDGGIDRDVLGALVFEDTAARMRLNAVVHPLVQEKIRAWLAEPGQGLKAAVIPLLFEVGWADEWDIVICVVSSETVQAERLMRVRGLSEEQARRRIAAQMPVAEKAARSQCVVHNETDAKALAREAVKVYRFLRETSE